MRRIYKIIGGMLAAGVLIAGIGSGIAFAEYSSFEYGGEVTLEGSQRFTKTVEYKVTAKNEDTSETGDSEKDREAVETDSPEEKVLNIYVGGYCTIVEDATVPKDVVRFAITYLSDNENISPSVDCTIVKNEEKIYEDLYVDTDFYYNDFRNIMRVKDLILSDLKNQRISDYQLDRVEQIQIYVNPDADFDINIEW